MELDTPLDDFSILLSRQRVSEVNSSSSRCASLMIFGSASCQLIISLQTFSGWLRTSLSCLSKMSEARRIIIAHFNASNEKGCEYFSQNHPSECGWVIIVYFGTPSMNMVRSSPHRRRDGTISWVIHRYSFDRFWFTDDVGDVGNMTCRAPSLCSILMTHPTGGTSLGWSRRVSGRFVFIDSAMQSRFLIRLNLLLQIRSSGTRGQHRTCVDRYRTSSVYCSGPYARSHW
jgi:hypothetical protein